MFLYKNKDVRRLWNLCKCEELLVRRVVCIEALCSKLSRVANHCVHGITANTRTPTQTVLLWTEDGIGWTTIDFVLLGQVRADAAGEQQRPVRIHRVHRP